MFTFSFIFFFEFNHFFHWENRIKCQFIDKLNSTELVNGYKAYTWFWFATQKYATHFWFPAARNANCCVCVDVVTSQRDESQCVRMRQDKGCNIAHYIAYPKNRIELRGPKSNQCESETGTQRQLTGQRQFANWIGFKGENSFTTPNEESKQATKMIIKQGVTVISSVYICPSACVCVCVWVRRCVHTENAEAIN